MSDFSGRTAILADGSFPTHAVALNALHGARRIVCCDGAATALGACGLEPAAVVGDLDSLDDASRARWSDRLVSDTDPEHNDLHKAFRLCMARGWRDIVVLGATGRREDHALGNLSLLADFAAEAPGIVAVDDHAVFIPLRVSGRFATFPGQQVSIFSFDPGTAITSEGLRYPLRALRLERWWQATLNEALGDSASLQFSGGPLLVCRCHADAGAARRGPAGGAPGSAQPVALTIAGSDSGGNAGIQADLRAFHALGVHGCTAIAALTAQNPSGVRGVRSAEAAFLALQLDAIFEAYDVGALKTGMLADAALIGAAADGLRKHPGVPAVVDPVMVATSGARLLADAAVSALAGDLLPAAALATPNLPEAAVLAGRTVAGREAACRAAAELRRRHGCAVLVKGGHDPAAPAEDVLCDGEGLWLFRSPRIAEPLSLHGTGCTLSAAIAGLLARRLPLREAVAGGKALVYEAIRTGRRVGPGAAVLGMPARIPREVVQVDRLPDAAP